MKQEKINLIIEIIIWITIFVLGNLIGYTAKEIQNVETHIEIIEHNNTMIENNIKKIDKNINEITGRLI